MNFEKRDGARGAALGLVLSILFGSASQADSVPATRNEALMAVLTENHAAEHFDACGTAPRLRLNEVCSVGTECDEDVRIADFVEVYNPTGQPAPLPCYVIATDEDLPFVPRGQLAPGSLEAWGEERLGFRVAKKRDQVRLYRMRAVDGKPGLEMLDQAEIGEARAVVYRSPDGGAWVAVPAIEAESERPATFSRPNR